MSGAVLQIEGHTPLRIIKEGKAPRPVKSDLAVFEGRVLKPEAIRPLLRFNVHHACAKVREIFADARTGGVRAELDNFHIGKRVPGIRLADGTLRADERRLRRFPDV